MDLGSFIIWWDSQSTTHLVTITHWWHSIHKDLHLAFMISLITYTNIEVTSALLHFISPDTWLFIQGLFRKHESFILMALCEGNPAVTSGFPTQRASDLVCISISWCHHVIWFYSVVWCSQALYYKFPDQWKNFKATQRLGYCRFLKDWMDSSDSPNLRECSSDSNINIIIIFLFNENTSPQHYWRYHSLLLQHS